MNKKLALEIRNVSKKFHVDNKVNTVLEDVNLEVKKGEFLSIVGASGCGKSTLLKIISGLTQTSSGGMISNGKVINKPSIEIGMIFQESRLFPWLTLEENIEFGIHKKMSKAEKKEIVDEHIRLVGLEGFEKAFPRQLSGGMQQRASIARTLINRPDILLLDEPFGALDALTRITMQNEILKIWEKEKTTMILVTHDIEEAIYLGDRIAIFSNRPGKIKRTVDINIERPRSRNGIRFNQIKEEIFSDFFSESDYNEVDEKVI